MPCQDNIIYQKGFCSNTNTKSCVTREISKKRRVEWRFQDDIIWCYYSYCSSQAGPEPCSGALLMPLLILSVFSRLIPQKHTDMRLGRWVCSSYRLWGAHRTGPHDYKLFWQWEAGLGVGAVLTNNNTIHVYFYGENSVKHNNRAEGQCVCVCVCICLSLDMCVASASTALCFIHDPHLEA